MTVVLEFYYQTVSSTQLQNFVTDYGARSSSITSLQVTGFQASVDINKIVITQIGKISTINKFNYDSLYLNKIFFLQIVGSGSCSIYMNNASILIIILVCHFLQFTKLFYWTKNSYLGNRIYLVDYDYI